MKQAIEIDLKLKKKKILIVEDNEFNLDLLCTMLEEEYEVMTAVNGEEGFDILCKNYRDLSLVLLDVYMPVCDGFEFLKRKGENPLLAEIPVIVTTGSNNVEDEVKCLDLGASDFVTKPYNSRVVIGRSRSIIKLRESKATLSAVEFDSLTGLLTMQAFIHHTGQVLRAYEDSRFNLIVADLKEFKFINGTFGIKKGDEVLVFLANVMKKFFPDAIISRQADKFFCLVFSDESITSGTFEEIRKTVVKDSPVPGVIVNFGFYPDIDKSQPVSILCDRVVTTVIGIKNDYSKSLAVYDEEVNSLRIAEQKLEREFNKALENEEFVVWFQPKYDCKTDKLVAAEALVRWRKADGTMVPPGAFIPLFEEDGLVAQLDEYVFRKVCAFQRKRLDEGKTAFPISVNLSRNSIYNLNMVGKCLNIIREYDIPIELIPVEITESAATGQNNVHKSCETLVESGFLLHMDDFGSGYSSLSNLSVVSFEVIKLDKSLIDEIGNRKGEIVVRHIIGIAKELGLKVVAEGVECDNQVTFLKENDCDQIQGFFYSKPVSQDIFEDMLD